MARKIKLLISIFACNLLLAFLLAIDEDEFDY